MFVERRKSQRQIINRVAKLYVGDNSLPRDCLITDISDGGARLHVEGVHVPDQFFLLIQSNPPVRRQCLVAWRLGYELGVQFFVREKSLPRYQDLLAEP